MQSLIPSPYQLVHLMKLRSNGHNCLLISDGVGVGKTISSGYAIFHQAMISRKPVLIVCPPILVDKWRNEMKTKFALDTRRANHKDTFDLMLDEVHHTENWDRAPVYVTTYSLLSRMELFTSPLFGMVVMDEVHSSRNPETRLYPILREICRKSEYRIGLSATPINNSITDLASILSLLMPKYSFVELNTMLEDMWGLPSSDSISSITTRFTKDHVGSHFTRRKIHTIEVESSQNYASFVNQQISEMFPDSDGFQLQTISMHRLAASSPPAFFKAIGRRTKHRVDEPKVSALLEILANKPEERFLVFTEFKETAEHISRCICDRLVLQTSGSSNMEEREANAFLFRETDSSVMVMTPVGSEGLDFQFCSNLVNFDLHWNPMKIEQRIGRIDRIGQEKDTVSIYNFHVLGSIDERVRDVMGDKLGLVTGTFADIPPVLNSTNSLVGTRAGERALEREFSSAKDLIRTSTFYTNTAISDIDVTELIQIEYCDFHQWSEQDWTTTFPWSGEVEVWLTSLSEESNKFSELLSFYTAKEDQ